MDRAGAAPRPARRRRLQRLSCEAPKPVLYPPPPPLGAEARSVPSSAASRGRLGWGGGDARGDARAAEEGRSCSLCSLFSSRPSPRGRRPCRSERPRPHPSGNNQNAHVPPAPCASDVCASLRVVPRRARRSQRPLTRCRRRARTRRAPPPTRCTPRWTSSESPMLRTNTRRANPTPPRARAPGCARRKHQTGSRVLPLEGGGARGFRARALALPVPAFQFPVPCFRFPDRYDGRQHSYHVVWAGPFFRC